MVIVGSKRRTAKTKRKARKKKKSRARKEIKRVPRYDPDPEVELNIEEQGVVKMYNFYPKKNKHLIVKGGIKEFQIKAIKFVKSVTSHTCCLPGIRDNKNVKKPDKIHDAVILMRHISEIFILTESKAALKWLDEFEREILTPILDQRVEKIDIEYKYIIDIFDRAYIVLDCLFEALDMKPHIGNMLKKSVSAAMGIKPDTTNKRNTRSNNHGGQEANTNKKKSSKKTTKKFKKSNKLPNNAPYATKISNFTSLAINQARDYVHSLQINPKKLSTERIIELQRICELAFPVELLTASSSGKRYYRKNIDEIDTAFVSLFEVCGTMQLLDLGVKFNQIVEGCAYKSSWSGYPKTILSGIKIGKPKLNSNKYANKVFKFKKIKRHVGIICSDHGIQMLIGCIFMVEVILMLLNKVIHNNNEHGDLTLCLYCHRFGNYEVYCTKNCGTVFCSSYCEKRGDTIHKAICNHSNNSESESDSEYEYEYESSTHSTDTLEFSSSELEELENNSEKIEDKLD